LGAKKNIIVINDEAHHGYRPKPDGEEEKLTGDECIEAKKRGEVMSAKQLVLAAACVSRLRVMAGSSYNRPVVQSVAHKGLERFYRTGSQSGIQAKHGEQLVAATRRKSLGGSLEFCL
jgi:hypothetical protein